MVARAASLGHGIKALPLACWGLWLGAHCHNSNMVSTFNSLSLFSRVDSDSQGGGAKNGYTSPRSPPTISSDASLIQVRRML